MPVAHAPTQPAQVQATQPMATRITSAGSYIEGTVSKVMFHKPSTGFHILQVISFFTILDLFWL